MMEEEPGQRRYSHHENIANGLHAARWSEFCDDFKVLYVLCDSSSLISDNNYEKEFSLV
jgi:hypothetical protein